MIGCMRFLELPVNMIFLIKFDSGLWVFMHIDVMLPCSIVADEVRFVFSMHREENRGALDCFPPFCFLKM